MMIPQMMAYNMQPVVAPKPKKKTMISASSTNRWMDEISKANPNESIMSILGIFQKNEFHFTTCDGPKYGSQHLIFTRPAQYQASKTQTSIVCNSIITFSQEFLEKPFGKELANKIVDLSRDFTSPHILELMRIGFPLNNNLVDCINSIYEEFQGDVQNPLLIKYNLNQKNFDHALNQTLKKQPKILPQDAFLSFMGHPFWQGCLLRRSEHDQKSPIEKSDSASLALVLWGTRQYPKWHAAISKKIWMLKQISTNNDIFSILSFELFELSLYQPIRELTAEKITVEKIKRVAKNPLADQPQTKRRRT